MIENLFAEDTTVLLEVERVARALPGVTVATGNGGAFAVDLDRFDDPDFDLSSIGWELSCFARSRAVGLLVRSKTHRDLAWRVRALSIHLRRFLPEPADAGLARAIAVHRALHDVDYPLVRADHEHAHDVRRWVRVLEPRASRALELAALFHDVERLLSESRERREQRAPDYRAFKEAHARAGAQLAAFALERAGERRDVVARVCELIACHESPGDDAERVVLNDADALSFFSVNASGFLDCYGEAHTRKKIAYTLARLSPRAWPWLAALWFRADFARLLFEHEPARKVVAAA